MRRSGATLSCVVDRLPTAHRAVHSPDGFVVVVKEECETCRMVAPVLAELATRWALTVYTQDDPSFPAGVAPSTTPTWP